MMIKATLYNDYEHPMGANTANFVEVFGSDNLAYSFHLPVHLHWCNPTSEEISKNMTIETIITTKFSSN